MRAAGAALAGAPTAAVLMHGRDQDAGFMLEVADRARLGDVAALLLPEAESGSWYPGRYYDPVEANEPALTAAVAAFEEAIDVATSAGVPLERVLLAGFSQGACLLTELLRRRPRRVGAAVVLTGAMMGTNPSPPLPPLDALPVHVSCSRHDGWIALEHALGAATALERAGARVTTVVSDEREHHVSDAEAVHLRELALALAS